MYYKNELCHFGIMGQKWGVRRYQNSDGSLTAAGKERYSGKDAKKNFIEDYKDTIKNNPYSTMYTSNYGVVTLERAPRNIPDYIAAQKANAKIFREINKDFAKKSDKYSEDGRKIYNNFASGKIDREVYNKNINELFTKYEEYGKKFIKEKFKDVLSMETDDFNDMLAINMIWMDEKLTNPNGGQMRSDQRMNMTNMEDIIQQYKRNGQTDLKKQFA